MRLNYDETNDIYVAPKHHSSGFFSSDSSSSPRASLLDDEQIKIGPKFTTYFLTMRRYFKLVLLLCVVVTAVLIYVTFFRRSLPGERTVDDGGKSLLKLSLVKGDLVKCDIYMESQCTDTTNFFQNQLTPSWPKIKDFVDLKIIPYGKAKETVKGDDFTFRCQHGTTECLVNQMMCCGMKRLDYRVERYLPFVECLQGEQPSKLRTCCERVNLMYDDVENCANGKEGRQLHHEMGNLTNSLKPKLFFVPWIVVNGKREKDATDEFVKVLCSKSKRHPKPEGCLS